MVDSSSTLRSAWHLASSDLTADYQPVRTNNFEFIVNFNGMFGSNVLDINSRDIIRFSVVKFDVPHFTQDKIEIKRGNSTIKFASSPSWKDGSLVINDFTGANGKSILKQWQEKSYNISDDTIPSSTAYKRDAIVMEYASSGELLNTWTLTGCWVSGINEDGWNNEQAAKKTLTATITFDKAILEDSRD